LPPTRLALGRDGRLLFAGEATCKQHPATVAGAYISGVREAGKQALRLIEGEEAKTKARKVEPADTMDQAAAAARFIST